MGSRILVMVSVMILELAAGISVLAGIDGQYPYRMDSGGVAGCVMTVALTVIAWLMTVAWFLKKSARAKAGRVLEDARAQAAQILATASDKALALCSLDGGKCQKCGNPRTGRFCPKCGASGQPSGDTNRDVAAPPKPTFAELVR
jgi:hypothetical protein